MPGSTSTHGDKDLLQICQQAIAIRYQDIPAAVVTRAQAQILSCLGAVYRGLPQRKIAEWRPQVDSSHPYPYDASQSLENNVLELAQLVSLLDYDEVILGGHLSQSAVLIPLLYGYQRGATGQQILRAIVLTNELAGRISIACALGKYRGQTALFVHQCAAVVAKALMLGLDAEQMAAALALALSFITRIDSRQFFSSDLKLLSATIPMQQGMHCVDQALKGLRGEIEFSNRRPRWARHYALLVGSGLFDDLGKCWYTSGLSIKQYPACAYMCAAIEAAQQLRQQHSLRMEDVEEITVHANLLQYLCDHKTRDLLVDPAPHFTVSAFSTPLSLAAVFVPDLHQSPSSLRDHWPKIETFCRSVSIHWDRQLALTTLLSGMPIGFPLARQPAPLAHLFIQVSLYKALGWRHYCLHLPRAMRLLWDYQRARRVNAARFLNDKSLGATVTIKTRDGRTLRHHCPTPRGFSQPELSAEQLLDIGLTKFNASRPKDVDHLVFASQAQYILRLLQTQPGTAGELSAAADALEPCVAAAV